MKELKSVCCVCDQKNNREETKRLQEKGYNVSHGYCPECTEVMLETVNKVDYILNNK